MPRKSPELKEQLKHLQLLRHAFEQRKLFELFQRAHVSLTKFLKRLSDARDACLSGDGELTIDSNRFAQMVELFEDAFLVILPTGVREGVRRKAKRMVADSEIISKLGVFTPLAEAELRLRLLSVLVLERLSGRFAAESRLPEWDQALREIRKELEASRAEWRDVSSALSRREG